MLHFLCALCLLFAAAPSFAWEPPEGSEWKSKTVTATAYCSYPDQTSNHPYLAAWNDELKPGMKVIAVSRDLLDEGLTHLTPVRIQGLPGTYIVYDKMNRKWHNHIDLYYGNNEKKALIWGKKRVKIYWKTKAEPHQTTDPGASHE